MMNIRIYQINLDRDEAGIAFESLGQMKRYQGSEHVRSEIYDKVYDGSVDADGLEEVFERFNKLPVDSYYGRSLSVSDVVEVESSESIAPGFYYCDSIGFKSIAFEPAKTRDNIGRNLRVVLCEPGQLAREIRIGTSLKDLQTVVEGLIEPFYPFDEPVCIVCNDEGKFNGMQPNRAVYDQDGKIMDVIFGPFFICDCRGEDFGSLSQEQIDKYLEQFRFPEMLFKDQDGIHAVKYDPERDAGLER